MRFPHQITFLSLQETQSPSTGIVTQEWAPFQTVMGAVEPLSVREFVSADVRAAEIVARLVFRYVPGVLPSMRALVDGVTTYKVEGVLPDKRSGTEYLAAPVSMIKNG